MENITQVLSEITTHMDNMARGLMEVAAEHRGHGCLHEMDALMAAGTVRELKGLITVVQTKVGDVVTVKLAEDYIEMIKAAMDSGFPILGVALSPIHNEMKMMRIFFETAAPAAIERMKTRLAQVH